MADPVTATATPPAPAPAAAAPNGQPPVAAAPPSSQQPPSQPSLLSPEPPKAEPAKEAPKQPPAEIKLTASKDSLLQQPQVDKIAAFARERGLSQDVAQAAMEFQNAQLKEFADGHVTAWKERVAGWEKELKAHKEFGGERLKEFDQGATDVVVKYGGQDLMKMLQETGYSKHPAVAQFLWNLHKAMRPDRIVTPQAASTGEKPDLATRLFPNTGKKA